MKRRTKRDAVVQPQDQSIRYIPLTQGKVAIVDAADYEWLMQWKWFARQSHSGKTWYVERTIKALRRKTVSMHRAILNPPEDVQVDHRDRDGLNNRRNNLREAAPCQNMYNQSRRIDNTSGFRGVSFNKKCRKWAAHIRVLGRKRYLGLFERAIDAARAYDDAAIREFGEFASANFPTSPH